MQHLLFGIISAFIGFNLIAVSAAQEKGELPKFDQIHIEEVFSEAKPQEPVVSTIPVKEEAKAESITSTPAEETVSPTSLPEADRPLDETPTETPSITPSPTVSETSTPTPSPSPTIILGDSIVMPEPIPTQICGPNLPKDPKILAPAVCL